jgi:hypothetical protein
MNSGNDKSWIERNVDLIFRVLVGFCVLLVALELVYEHHPHFIVDGWPAFYAIFGFVSFVFIVFAGKWLRRLIMRDEDYYDRR